MFDLAGASRLATRVLIGWVMLEGGACDRPTLPHPSAAPNASDTTATTTMTTSMNAVPVPNAEGGALGAVPHMGQPADQAAGAAAAWSSSEPADSNVPVSAGSCPEDDDASVAVLVNPADPWVGGVVHVLAADFGSDPLSLRLEALGAKTAPTRIVDTAVVFREGPPVSSVARFRPERPGKYRVVVGRGQKGLRCVRFSVGDHRGKRLPRTTDPMSLWPVRRSWTEGEEALYGSWLREMFHAPVGDELAFSKLDEVTSDPERNLLFDFWGWGEDSSGPIGLRLKPDCADTPYFFRAYFAWKRGLPFGFRSCDGGRPGIAPTCGALHAVAPRSASDERQESMAPEPTARGEVLSAGQPKSGSGDRPDIARLIAKAGRPTRNRDGKSGELLAMQDFFARTLAWGVHTGNGRTAFGNDVSDFYPVSLTVHGLRPGTIYADPYGHVLTIVEKIPAARGRQGVLYAVDGQPDGSITRKRFWEGNFLFNPDPALGGSGFKAFRPLILRHRGAERRLVALSDDEIAHRAGYGDASPEQASLTPEQFYDQVERLVTPFARDPFLAEEELVRALAEAAHVRVTSVANAEKYFADRPAAVIPMPAGESIFDATGPWEDYSTPSRDLRLLIAMRVVREFEKKVQRNPDAFAHSGDSGPSGEAGAPGPGGSPARNGNQVNPQGSPLVANTASVLDREMQALVSGRDRLLTSPELAFDYTRSDGSHWTISLSELMARATALEVAYNPNDCPEVRWGAPAGSAEMSTCRRHAPEEQRRRMEAYRMWFRERRRPPRGDPGPAAR